MRTAEVIAAGDGYCKGGANYPLNKRTAEAIKAGWLPSGTAKPQWCSPLGVNKTTLKGEPLEL